MIPTSADVSAPLEGTLDFQTSHSKLMLRTIQHARPAQNFHDLAWAEGVIDKLEIVGNAAGGDIGATDYNLTLSPGSHNASMRHAAPTKCWTPLFSLTHLNIWRRSNLNPTTFTLHHM